MLSFQYTETKYMLTVQETARVLGISIYTVYRLIDSGELSAVKISQRKTVIKAEILEKYINRKWGDFGYEGNIYTKRNIDPWGSYWDSENRKKYILQITSNGRIKRIQRGK